MITWPKKISSIIISALAFWPQSILARGWHSNHAMSSGEAIFLSLAALFGLLLFSLSLWGDGKKTGALIPIILAGIPAFALYKEVNWGAVGFLASLLGVLIAIGLVIVIFDSLLPNVSRAMGTAFNVATGTLGIIMAFLFMLAIPAAIVIGVVLAIVKALV